MNDVHPQVNQSQATGAQDCAAEQALASGVTWRMTCWWRLSGRKLVKSELLADRPRNGTVIQARRDRADAEGGWPCARSVFWGRHVAATEVYPSVRAVLRGCTPTKWLPARKDGRKELGPACKPTSALVL